MENAIMRNKRPIPLPTIPSMTPPICKIKYEVWGDYQIIGFLPGSFKELTKVISGVVYPNNFSLDYFGEGFILISLNAGNFKNLLKFVKDNSLREVKLFVNVQEEIADPFMPVFGNKNSNLTNISGNKLLSQFCEDLTPRKRRSARESNYTTYTIKETEEHSSTSHENNSVTSINSDDTLGAEKVKKYTSEKCLCTGKRIKTKDKKREKIDKNCIYCY